MGGARITATRVSDQVGTILKISLLDVIVHNKLALY